jgi:hypothetical protein
MKATLVFNSNESEDISIGMVFTPCLSWVIGKTVLLTPHRDYPNYRKGDLSALLDLSKLSNSVRKTEKKLAVVVHKIGHGEQSDIDQLLDEAVELGFSTTVVKIN